MSKRQSQESRIIEWFETAPMTSVGIVLGIVKEKVRMRNLGEAGVTVVRKSKKKGNSVDQTVFPAGVTSNA